MITDKAARKIAMQFPGAEEKDHFGEPSFRVRNKIFLTVRPSEKVATVKLPLDHQQMLAETKPDIFFIGGWAHQGWTRIRLTKIDTAYFKHVVTASWKNVAPKRLVKAFEDSGQK